MSDKSLNVKVYEVDELFMKLLQMLDITMILTVGMMDMNKTSLGSCQQLWPRRGLKWEGGEQFW